MKKNINYKKIGKILGCILAMTFGLYLGNGFANLTNFIIGTIGIICFFVFTAAAVEAGVKDYMANANQSRQEAQSRRFGTQGKRTTYYILSICVLYTFVALTIGVISAPGSPGDTEEWSRQVATDYSPGIEENEQAKMRFNMFLALLAPTLIGVHFGLGDKNES